MSIPFIPGNHTHRQTEKSLTRHKCTFVFFICFICNSTGSVEQQTILKLILFVDSTDCYTRRIFNYTSISIVLGTQTNKPIQNLTQLIVTCKNIFCHAQKYFLCAAYLSVSRARRTSARSCSSSPLSSAMSLVVVAASPPHSVTITSSNSNSIILVLLCPQCQRQKSRITDFNCACGFDATVGRI